MMTSETKRKLLNGRELIAAISVQNEIEPSVLVRGTKANFPAHTDEEQATIQSYLDDLRKVLSLERITPKGSRSIASLENGVIKIIKRTGKWDGYESTGTVLEPHEALFLIEINRLEVYMGKMIVSLERAYHIFLAHDTTHTSDKLTKMEYLVYAHFMRFGCNLKRFKNEMPSPASKSSSNECHLSADGNDSSNSDSTNMDNTTDDKLYVWNYLYDLLGHRRSILPWENIDRTHYARIKQSMNDTINNFKEDQNPYDSDTSEANDEITEPPPQKRRRKCSSTGTSNVDHVAMLSESRHKHDLDDPYLGSGSLNDFMIGSTFKRFKQIFDKIDFIELKTMNYADEYSSSSSDTNNPNESIIEKFSFDLWTSQDYRRSQPKPPDFRIIVKQPSKTLPSNDDIFKLYRSLLCKSAIILVCINEEMSFQAYVYRLTT